MVLTNRRMCGLLRALGLAHDRLERTVGTTFLHRGCHDRIECHFDQPRNIEGEY